MNLYPFMLVVGFVVHAPDAVCGQHIRDGFRLAPYRPGAERLAASRAGFGYAEALRVRRYSCICHTQVGRELPLSPLAAAAHYAHLTTCHVFGLRPTDVPADI